MSITSSVINLDRLSIARESIAISPVEAFLLGYILIADFLIAAKQQAASVENDCFVVKSLSRS